MNPQFLVKKLHIKTLLTYIKSYLADFFKAFQKYLNQVQTFSVFFRFPHIWRTPCWLGDGLSSNQGPLSRSMITLNTSWRSCQCACPLTVAECQFSHTHTYITRFQLAGHGPNRSQLGCILLLLRCVYVPRANPDHCQQQEQHFLLPADRDHVRNRWLYIHFYHTIDLLTQIRGRVIRSPLFANTGSDGYF